MNTREDMQRPDAPDWELIAELLGIAGSAKLSYSAQCKCDRQASKLRAWLAAQPVAPEGGEDGDVPLESTLADLEQSAQVFEDNGMVETACEVMKAVREIRAAFARATPPAPAREAVAWQYRYRCPDEPYPWTMVAEGDLHHYLFSPDKFETRELYAHPAAGAVVVDEAERIADSVFDGLTAKHMTRTELVAALTAAIGGA